MERFVINNSSKSIEEIVQSVLEEDKAEVMKQVQLAIGKSMGEAVRETREHVRSAHVGRRYGVPYAHHIADKFGPPTGSRKSLSKDYFAMTWYVRSPEYSLSHLLENGHDIYGGHGRRTKADPFISAAAEKAKANCQERIIDAINRLHS